MVSKLGLVLITDRKICRSPLIDIIKLSLKGGVNTVQLREKDLSAKELFELAMEIKCLTDEAGANLIINDRPDVMVAVGGSGVHVGIRSMPIKAVRKVIGNKKLIGYSAHSVEEAKLAQENGADYVSISPIFETNVKPGGVPQKPLGPGVIKVVKGVVRVPVVALGGINENNVNDVVRNDADGVALISGVLLAPNPFNAAEKICKVMQRAV